MTFTDRETFFSTNCHEPKVDPFGDGLQARPFW